MRAGNIPAPPKHRQSPRLSRPASIASTQSPNFSISSLSTRSTSAIAATCKPHLIEIQIPHVPRYVPNTKLPEELDDQKIAAVTLANDRRNGVILSRFTTDDGRIGFTIRLPYANGAEVSANGSEISADMEEVDADLASIYDYVTPVELERYEHHEIELEAEREANRPRVGRPRKRSPGLIISTEIMGEEIPMKRPLGRPRKRPAALNENTRTGLAERTHEPRLVFAGVHIPSPVRAGQTSSTILSKPISSAASESASSDLFQAYPGDDTSATGQEETPEVGETSINIDQLTPSNARRVIGIPQQSPKYGTHRPSYSMIEAALSASDTEESLPQSPSEDELSSLLPITQQRRFSAVAEVAESNASDIQDPILLSSSSSSLNDCDKSSRSMSVDRDMEELLSDDEAVGNVPDDLDRLLQQFHAKNTRRLPPQSPTLMNHTLPPLSHAPRRPKAKAETAGRLSQYSNSAHPAPLRSQTTPTTSRYIRKSMTPHFPSAGKSIEQTIESHMRGGLRHESLGIPIERYGRGKTAISPMTTYDEITLGSQEVQSSDGDRQIIRDTIHSRHTPSLNDAPLRDENQDITLGTPVSSSSGETNGDTNPVQDMKIGRQHNTDQKNRNGERSSSPGGIANRWFGGMPWR
ncbi:hypothetical protein XANCAGTX0491_005545 [Xanthoria calcicola]